MSLKKITETYEPVGLSDVAQWANVSDWYSIAKPTGENDSFSSGLDVYMVGLDKNGKYIFSKNNKHFAVPPGNCIVYRDASPALHASEERPPAMPRYDEYKDLTIVQALQLGREYLRDNGYSD